MKTYVAYYRVSTKVQNESGLGLESQRSIVENFIKTKGIIHSSYTEVESGKNNNRPQLNLALDECKKNGYTLIISKLDRLSRNYAFVGTLQDSKVDFVCCDMPDANSFTIGIFALIAQQEREFISSRTKAALDALKQRGVKLGGPNAKFNDNARARSKEVLNNKRINNPNNRRASTVVNLMKDNSTLQQIANKLNEDGFKTSRGGLFNPTSVRRLIHQ